MNNDTRVPLLFLLNFANDTADGNKAVTRINEYRFLIFYLLFILPFL